MSARNYALAALLAALGEGAAAARTGERDAAVLRGKLAEVVRDLGARGLLAESDAVRLARLLLPLDSGAGDATLAAALREHLEASGIFLEARLRALLDAGVPLEGVLEKLPPDSRLLLALTARRLRERPAGERPRGDEDAAAALDSEADAICRGVAEQTLQRQVQVAHRWMSDGVFEFSLPVRLRDEEPRAVVRFRREGAAMGAEAPVPSHLVEVHVDSGRVGAVHAVARWSDAACEATFFVTSDAASAALCDELETLRTALSTGFARVVVDVLVDPARAAGPGVEMPTGLAAGSVVSVRT